MCIRGTLRDLYGAHMRLCMYTRVHMRMPLQTNPISINESQVVCFHEFTAHFGHSRAIYTRSQQHMVVWVQGQTNSSINEDTPRKAHLMTRSRALPLLNNNNPTPIHAQIHTRVCACSRTCESQPGQRNGQFGSQDGARHTRATCAYGASPRLLNVPLFRDSYDMSDS